MAALNEIKSVMKKICSIDELNKHICFFGGAIPYLYFNQESNREHTDIDVLIDEEYIDIVRNLAQQYNLYNPELDSLNLDLDDDYGFKLSIDGIYVEFEPMSIDNNMLIRKDFSPNKEQAGIEKIPFQELSDLISKINIDGIETFCYTPELTKADKEQYKREKDIEDINFINNQDVDNEKYKRVKRSVSETITVINNYEDIRTKKTL